MSRAAALPAEERRAAIVASTLELLLERGTNVSTRQIAEAAGIAEGTIFRVFPDKDGVLRAAVELAFDPEPAERALLAIDRTRPFDDQLVEAVGILQRRFAAIWRLMSMVGDPGTPRPPADFAALEALFRTQRHRLRYDPATAARQLRALTLAVTHPMTYPDGPMPPDEVVSLFLDGIRTRPRLKKAAPC